MEIILDLPQNLFFTRSAVVGAIMKIRHELERDTWGGESLLEAKGPIVLVLNDLAEGLGLTLQERELALGQELVAEIEEFVG